MKFADKCLRPYIVYGDVAQCWMENGHPKTCEDANRDRAPRPPTDTAPTAAREQIHETTGADA